MTAMAMLLKPIGGGWSVVLTDGRELARFTGPLARYHAERWLRRVSSARGARGGRG